MLNSRPVKIGVWGGMGMIAGTKFLDMLANAYKGIPEKNHPEILFVSDPTLPRRDVSVEQDLSGVAPKIFLKKALATLKFFKSAKVDFVVAPCNTFHYFRDKLQKESGVKILDMISIVRQHTLKDSALKTVGLLSTEAPAKAKLYQNEFKKHGTNIVLPSPENQKKVNFIIEQVKLGRAKETATQVALQQVVSAMVEVGVKIIILGCTEIPVVPWSHADKSINLINTTEALVEGTKAMAKQIATSSLAKNQNRFLSNPTKQDNSNSQAQEKKIKCCL
jgi:aspartate racemase